MGRVKRTGRGSAQRAISRPETVSFLHLSIPFVEGGLQDDDSLGEWHARTASIHFDPSQDDAVLRETLLHEMLHAVCEHTGIDPDEHEAIIRGISPLLLHLMRENPLLMAWLIV